MKLTGCIVLSAALFAVSACKKDDKSDTGGSSKTSDKADKGAKADKGGDKADKGGGEAKAAGGPVEIAAYGLVIELAGGQVSELMGDQMVQGTSTLVTVGLEEEPKTLEAAVEEAGMYDPKITKQEKLADGYHLEFNNTGGMGANYFVEVVRKIGDKTYKCSTTTGTPEQSAEGAKACLTLRAK